jgi:hypothetical protein
MGVGSPPSTSGNMTDQNSNPYSLPDERNNAQPKTGFLDAQAVDSRSSDAAAVPDINTILAELAQYSSAQQRSDQAAQVPQGNHQLQPHQEQWNQQPQPFIQPSSNRRSLDPRRNTQHRQTTTPPAQPSSTPLIDPASILEWPLALRCVNKLSAQNPNFGPAIKVVSAVTIMDTVNFRADTAM